MLGESRTREIRSAWEKWVQGDHNGRSSQGFEILRTAILASYGHEYLERNGRKFDVTNDRTIDPEIGRILEGVHRAGDFGETGLEHLLSELGKRVFVFRRHEGDTTWTRRQRPDCLPPSPIERYAESEAEASQLRQRFGWPLDQPPEQELSSPDRYSRGDDGEGPNCSHPQGSVDQGWE